MFFISKAQTWSIDILVAVFIFIAIFIMFTGIMASMSETRSKEQLSERGEKITRILSADSQISFITRNKINESKLKEIVGDYDSLKEEFDFENFCVYFEDEKGNIIPIDNDAGVYYGAGNSRATMNQNGVAIECGQAS